jgi:hypothetical protein
VTDRRIAQSFSAEEVQIMDLMLRAMMTGGDVKIIARRPAFKNLARKIVVMRQKLEQPVKAEETEQEVPA